MVRLRTISVNIKDRPERRITGMDIEPTPIRTPAEHYRVAEDHLAIAHSLRETGDHPQASRHLEFAHVHAILATVRPE